MRNGVGASVDEPRRNVSEFLIRHDRLDLRIFLSPAKSLLIHEETIPSRVSLLKNSLLLDGLVRDPIVVDADSLVVLDGMHRVAALKEMGCSFMPVCAVDYLNPSIQVGTWFRVLSGQVDYAQFKAEVASSSIRMEQFSTDIADFAQNPSLAVVFPGEDCYRLTSGHLGFAEILKAAERCARELYLNVEFETEHDAVQRLLSGTANAIITLPKISKGSIREAGLTGRLLPHKVTRHIIPARPLGVDVHLNMLANESLRLEEANQHFIQNLLERGVMRRPPGAVIEGRRYEEETFIFN